MINEALNDEMEHLMAYLSKGKYERMDELADRFAHLLDYFLKEKPMVAKREGEPTHFWEMTQKGQDSFKRWLVDNLIVFNDESKKASGKYDINPEELPSWRYLKVDREVEDEWMIHQTYDAESIARLGFRSGMKDASLLGLTVKLDDDMKKGGGYNFSFLLKDAIKYGFNKNTNLLMSQTKYGFEGVLFKADGIRCWHRTDKDFQTIFWGATARNIIPIERMDRYYAVTDKDGNEYCGNPDFMEVVRCILIKLKENPKIAEKIYR